MKLCFRIDKISLQMESYAFLVVKIVHPTVKLKQCIIDEKILSAKK